jgi:hypothetical protein
MYVPNRWGPSQLSLTNPVITQASVVHVSVCPAIVVFGRVLRLTGDADVYVGWICPGSGRVDFLVNVTGPHPMNLITDISIFDPPPGGLVIGT